MEVGRGKDACCVTAVKLEPEPHQMTAIMPGATGGAAKLAAEVTAIVAGPGA
jgi:hypothetical protein